MRQKRAKAYRKLMALYSMSFGFRQPYQVLGASQLLAPNYAKHFPDLLTYYQWTPKCAKQP